MSDPRISVRLDDDTQRRLNEEVQATGKNESELVREALAGLFPPTAAARELPGSGPPPSPHRLRQASAAGPEHQQGSFRGLRPVKRHRLLIDTGPIVAILSEHTSTINAVLTSSLTSARPYSPAGPSSPKPTGSCTATPPPSKVFSGPSRPICSPCCPLTKTPCPSWRAWYAAIAR